MSAASPRLAKIASVRLGETDLHVKVGGPVRYGCLRDIGLTASGSYLLRIVSSTPPTLRMRIQQGVD